MSFLAGFPGENSFCDSIQTVIKTTTINTRKKTEKTAMDYNAVTTFGIRGLRHDRTNHFGGGI
jgi:hypothetical protein